MSYESFVSEYQAANVVLPLEDYINSSKYGLSAQDLQDFYPVYISGNQYAEYNSQMLSFPFTKSALVMYYNADKLKEAGLTLPKTWDEFVSSCKKFTGDMKGYAINIDASTFNGAVYSNGGKLINDDQKSWAFNGPAGIKFLRDTRGHGPERLRVPDLQGQRRPGRVRRGQGRLHPRLDRRASRSTRAPSIRARSSTGTSR